MTKEEIMRLAMLDAETESLENLRAAADIYDRLIRSQRRGSNPIIVQDDISGTPLPNGSLHWFGFDFHWADLPDEPLLREDDPPRWVGSWPGFTFKTGVSDARVTVEIDEFEQDGDYEEWERIHVTPKRYIVTVEAHGLARTEVFTCPSWHEVQQKCRTMEYQLDEGEMERHLLCYDEDGNTTADTCLFCERGTPGG